MTKISKEDVLKLARLARLKLTDKEIEKYSDEFSEIFGYIEQLSDADTEGLTPTYQVHGQSGVGRADELVDYGTTPASLLKNVPKVSDNQIEVKRMVG